MVKPDIKVNYYAALELPNTATDDEIKSQYRKLGMCQLHASAYIG